MGTDIAFVVTDTRSSSSQQASIGASASTIRTSKGALQVTGCLTAEMQRAVQLLLSTDRVRTEPCTIADVCVLLCMLCLVASAADFSLKLMDIDSEHLAIPETEYSATVRMPACEQRRGWSAVKPKPTRDQSYVHSAIYAALAHASTCRAICTA
jgi:hypothetical protein